MKRILMTALAILTLGAFAEVQIINGKKYECRDGVCYQIDDDEGTPGKEKPASGALAALLDAAAAATAPEPAATNAAPAAVPAPAAVKRTRFAEGYMDADQFVSFLEGKADADFLAGKAWWLVLVLVLVGGLAMNLTPCVLPMVPINLMVIGKSAVRGAVYGLGIALAYGTMGVLAAVFGMAFGAIQSNPWFNLAIAVLFVFLGLALSGVFFIDLSKGRGGVANSKRRGSLVFAFFMGAVSAVLAGACVAPILIAVLLLTVKLTSTGAWWAFGLPFVLGLGMALPWPFIGAGLQVLPKPGMWMKKVNVAFAVLVFAFAAWYAFLAWKGFAAKPADAASDPASATPATFAERLAAAKKPVFVDCWATWCKNCAAMERTTFRDPKVVKALEPYTVIRLQAEDMKDLRRLDGFADVKGLPAFAVFE